MKKVLFLFCAVFFISAINVFAMENKENVKLDSLAADGVRIVEYIPQGVCSQLIHIRVDKNEVIEKVEFVKGCSGNTKGIGALIKGMKLDEAIKRLKGITCGNKNTSCPDQLANALIYIKRTKK